MKRLKVFMTAYACEPDLGSEPGVGWGWVNGLAEHVDLTVATRANNQKTIEDWYAKHDPVGRKRRPTFVYHDPPSFLQKLKKRGIFPIQAFFAIWKVMAIFRYRGRLPQYDIVHHLTYGSIQLPGLWWGAPCKVVTGPIGGTSTVKPQYRSLYGKRIWKEYLRSLMIKSWRFLPWVRLSFSRADLITCSNSEAGRIIGEVYPDKVETITEIGADRERVPEKDGELDVGGDLKLIWIGMVEPWKAWSIALTALAEAREMLGDERGIHLTMLGRGREEGAAHQLAKDLGIEDNVTFLRRIPLEELHSRIRAAHAMVFSSVKDTSGTVVLEAMENGKALVCINHQGVGDISTDETAIRVEPASLPETITGFANAYVRLARNPQLCVEMGNAARERVLSDYIWERKADKMMGFYRKHFPELFTGE